MYNILAHWLVIESIVLSSRQVTGSMKVTQFQYGAKHTISNNQGKTFISVKCYALALSILLGFQ